jgi:putative DNA primase/helicase
MSAKALLRAGIVPRHDRSGTQRLACPRCNRAKRDDALAMAIDASGGVVWYCHRCGFAGGTRRNVDSPVTVGAPRPQPDARKPIDPLAYFRASLLLAGVAVDYLRYRHCVTPPLDGDLRWRARVRAPGTDHAGPAIVGLITHAVTDEPMSIHWTYIQPDGAGKASIERPRRLAAGRPKKHGVIRLWPDEAVDSALGIAEGIETALSAAHAFRPVWACVDAGNMAEFPVLDGIACLTVFGDRDDAGIQAASACSERWAIAEREVRVFVPPAGDVNDMLSQ